MEFETAQALLKEIAASSGSAQLTFTLVTVVVAIATIVLVVSRRSSSADMGKVVGTLGTLLGQMQTQSGKDHTYLEQLARDSAAQRAAAETQAALLSKQNELIAVTVERLEALGAAIRGWQNADVQRLTALSDAVSELEKDYTLVKTELGGIQKQIADLNTEIAALRTMMMDKTIIGEGERKAIDDRLSRIEQTLEHIEALLKVMQAAALKEETESGTISE